MVSIEYLESERIKIWEQIVDLQDSVKKKTSDYEYDAKQASKKCSEYKNKCEAAKNEAKQFLDVVQNASDEIQRSNISSLISEIQIAHDELIPKKAVISEQITQLESLFSSYAAYADKLKKLTDLTSEADETSTKIETVYKQLSNRKKEIDELYYEVFGYSETDSSTGEKTEIKGLKDELDSAYTELKSDFKEFSINKDKEFSDTLNNWKAEYISVSKQIESLLPNALTAGLSHAYSNKKDAEIKESAELEKVFKKYVNGLIGISLIPFFISIYLLITGVSLDDAILKMPRLVLSILPLYIPVLWVAYSANKKINLSKRLIEEYTHKEVLSKTFEGLAKQIQDIDDTDISSDLKTRLLYNILEVSSENPGKLISDYNKSDHPLMDALDKSVKLTNAVEHLNKIPGMSKLVNVLDSKSKEMLEKEAEKAAAGLEKIDKG